MEAPGRDSDARREASVHRGADRTPLRAEIPAARAAPRAGPAGREVRLGDDARAQPALVDVLPELGDDAGDLVAERHRGPRGELVVLDMEIGAADPGRRDIEHDVTGARCRLGSLGERDMARPRRELRDAEH